MTEWELACIIFIPRPEETFCLRGESTKPTFPATEGFPGSLAVEEIHTPAFASHACSLMRSI